MMCAALPHRQGESMWGRSKGKQTVGYFYIFEDTGRVVLIRFGAAFP